MIWGGKKKRKKRGKTKKVENTICQHCEIGGLFCLLGVLITVLSFQLLKSFCFVFSFHSPRSSFMSGSSSPSEVFFFVPFVPITGLFTEAFYFFNFVSLNFINFMSGVTLLFSARHC